MMFSGRFMMVACLSQSKNILTVASKTLNGFLYWKCGSTIQNLVLYFMIAKRDGLTGCKWIAFFIALGLIFNCSLKYQFFFFFGGGASGLVIK